MSPHVNPAYGELEALLLQIERLSAELVAGLEQAKENLEQGLDAPLQQRLILRGQLIQQAQALANQSVAPFSEEEQKSVAARMKALDALQQQLLSNMEAHRKHLRQALKGTTARQNSLKGYGHSQVRLPKPFLEDA